MHRAILVDASERLTVAQYQVKVLNDDYSLAAWLDQWITLRYQIALNRMTSASLDLPANDDKIPDCELMNRLLIVRNGDVVWGGILQTESWEVKSSADGTNESPYALDALDYCLYLQWRTIERPAGQDFDERTGPADDLAKAYIYYHAGAGAVTARQFSDLTVQANAGACCSVTKLLVGGNLLDHVSRLATEAKFYWRMVPSATGVEFQTAYPLWGVDRTKGNGVNDELVFAFDRRNVQQMSYKRDLSDHYNHIYVAGNGEGQDQALEEVSDAAAVAAYKRRELWASASNYSEPADLQAEGQRVLQQRRVYELMGVVPLYGKVTLDNLGDKVTAFERRYGRIFEYTAVITALDVVVSRAGYEQITVAEMVAA